MSKASLNSIDPAELARCLFEESNDAFFLFEPMDMTLVEVNPAAQRLTQLPRKALLQRTLPELLDGDQRSLADLLGSCQSTQMFHSKEAYWLVLDSGRRLPVNITISRLHLKPLPLGLLAVRDLSQRRSVEAQLREAQAQLESMVHQQAANLEAATHELYETERRMQELVDDLDVIVWESTLPDFQFTYVSQHAESVLGYPVSQWISEANFWEDHIHPDDRSRSMDSCLEAAQRGDDHQFEYRMIASDGGVRWIRDVVHVVTDAQGKPQKLRGVMLDFTSEAEAESELRAKERELAHVSRLSTMGELMAGVAHEINQPLAAIANFADASLRTLDGDRANPSIRDWVQEIVEQSARCADIVRRLRQFGSQDHSHRGPVSFTPVVQQSLGLLESLLRDHNIATNLKLPPSDTTVLANETELQQVVVILVRNACDALIQADTTGAEVRLHAEVVGEMLQLSIADNGPGISAELKDRIFDAFFTTKEDGMGMGLAICRSIIDRHMGQLWLEHCDTGANFVLRLPLAGVETRGL